MGPLTLAYLLDLGGVAAAIAADLAQAIEARWTAAGLAASVGPLHEDRAPAGTPGTPPHGVFTIRRGAPYLLTSTSSTYDYRVTFRVRDLTGAGARARAALVVAAFDGLSLSWSGGRAARLTQARWSSEAEASYSPGTRQAFRDEIEYTTRAQGAR